MSLCVCVAAPAFVSASATALPLPLFLPLCVRYTRTHQYKSTKAKTLAWQFRETPLDKATEKGHTDVAALLKAAGVGWGHHFSSW